MDSSRRVPRLRSNERELGHNLTGIVARFALRCNLLLQVALRHGASFVVETGHKLRRPHQSPKRQLPRCHRVPAYRRAGCIERCLSGSMEARRSNPSLWRLIPTFYPMAFIPKSGGDQDRPSSRKAKGRDDPKQVMGETP